MSEFELKFNFLHGATLQYRYYNKVLGYAAVLQWSYDMTSQAGDDDDEGCESYYRAGGAQTPGLALPASLRISQQFLPFPLPGPGWAGSGERGWRLEVVHGLAPDITNCQTSCQSLPSLVSTSATSPPWSVHWTPGDSHRSSQRTVCLPVQRKSVRNEISRLELSDQPCDLLAERREHLARNRSKERDSS